MFHAYENLISLNKYISLIILLYYSQFVSQMQRENIEFRKALREHPELVDHHRAVYFNGTA